MEDNDVSQTARFPLTFNPQRIASFPISTKDSELGTFVRNCGSILVRLSWHDAGVFNGVDGCPNAAMRLRGSNEQQMDANAGLPQIALSLLGPIAAKYVPRLISHADLWVVAANVAIRVMGGPTIITRYGRIDATNLTESVSSASGRLPEAHKDEHHLRILENGGGNPRGQYLKLSCKLIYG